MKAEKNRIKQIVESNRITNVVHFTQHDNLDSIMSHGLCTRTYLEERGIPFEFNDDDRLEGHADSISISITFPNAHMFFKCRNESECNWIVILIKPSILWLKKCLFCQQNAASAEVTILEDEYLESPEALEAMFVDQVGTYDRRQQRLKPYDPTHPQAEVLVLENVGVEFITAIIFDDETLHNQFKKKTTSIASRTDAINKGYFGSRSYNR